MKTIYLSEKRKITQRRIKKITKKLDKQNKKEGVILVLSKQLFENDELIEKVLDQNIQILDGRWLLKFLILDILEYFGKQKNKDIETLNLAIMVNNR